MKVVNIHKSTYTVFIGRPSRFGNPFRIGRDGTRAQVIKLYENWVRRHPDTLRRIRRLKVADILGCYCAPELCHGDVIRKI